MVGSEKPRCCTMALPWVSATIIAQVGLPCQTVASAVQQFSMLRIAGLRIAHNVLYWAHVCSAGGAGECSLGVSDE
jgi:hypothetical protein